MANLETLELTINGSATSAKQGIETLITSLASLSSALVKPYSDLRDFNEELKKMKEYCSKIKLPDIGKLTGAKDATKKAKKAVPTGEYNVKEERIPAVPDEEYNRRYAVAMQRNREQMAYRRYMNNFYRKRQELESKNLIKKEDTDASPTTGTAQANEASKAIKEQVPLVQKLKQGFNDLTKSASSFFSRIKKIATTMLIRTAIRALIKDIREGVNNLYEWSKLNNGDFAKSMDTFRNKALELKNSIGASIAPLIQAVIPILNSLANAAIEAFNWINQLFALLTGQSYWTKATDKANAYTESAKSAGKASKDWLAAFDELNVMTQDSGGGGSSTKPSDYADMFENVTVFDEKIRDIVDFLKSNLESIKAIAIATGVAILGWKISQAFADVIPALSKIAGLIGVGAVIAITLQANWMLTNKFLETGEDGWLIASVLTTAIGSVGAGFIAQKIFGGQAASWTISFTLALSAITDIVANINKTDVSAFDKESLWTNIKAALTMGAATGVILATVGNLALMPTLAAAGGVALFTFAVATGLKLLTQKKDIKWGNIKLTQEQIEQYVAEKMFDTPVKILIDRFKDIITEKQTLENQIKSKILSLQMNLDMLVIGLDKETTLNNIKNILVGEDGQSGLVKDVAKLCDMNIEMLKLTFSNIEMYNGNGEVISSDVLLSGMQGWNAIKAEMEANGKELTELLMKGARGELTPEMEAYTQELLEKVMGMSAKITKSTEFGKATAEFKTAALSAMSQDSFEGITSAFSEYSSQYEETIRSTLLENISSWYTLAELTDDPKLKKEYQDIAKQLEEGFETTVAEELKKETAPGRQLIMDWIFGKHEQGSLDSYNRLFTGQMYNLLSDAGVTAENMKYIIRELLKQNQITPEEINVMDMIGFTGWELLSDNLKTLFLGYVNISDDTIKELKKVGVPATDIVKFINWGDVEDIEQQELIASVVNAYGATGIASIKSQFPEIKAESLVKVVKWNDLSTTQKFEFLNAIKTAFGSKEAQTAAKNSGIDIGALVQEGMKSKDTNIQAQAKEWHDIINTEVTKNPPVVTPELKAKIEQEFAKKIKDGIEGVVAVVGNVSTEFKSGNPDNLKASVESLTPTVTSSTVFKSGNPNNLKVAIEGIGATISNVIAQFQAGYPANLKTDIEATDATVDAKVGVTEASKRDAKNEIQDLMGGQKVTVEVALKGVQDMATKLADAVKNALKVTVDVKDKDTGDKVGSMTLVPAYTGGLFDSGDIFMANENGTSEMIGRFGNQTGVANQREIVAGIQKGVSDANQEQNALLREQNSLLRWILAKDSSVRLGASSALGRTVQQSLEMYNVMVGG